MSACGHGTLKSKCDECDRLAYIKFLESKNSKLKVKLRKCREALKDCFVILESYQHETGAYKKHPLYVMGTNEAIAKTKQTLEETG